MPHLLHFQCVRVVCSSVGVLNVLLNDLSLLRALVNNLPNNKHIRHLLDIHMLDTTFVTELDTLPQSWF